MRNILIVDDESDILFGFKKSLENEEISVDTVETLDQAKELIEKREYFCVITDLRLSGVYDDGGFEVLKYVKEKRPSAHVIVITGHGNASTMHEAYSLGATFYYEKPVSARTLKESLTKLSTEKIKGVCEGMDRVMEGVNVEEADGVMTVHFAGEITIEKVLNVARVLCDTIANAKDVILNVKLVTKIDISGLQLFCAAHKTCAELNVPLSLEEQRSPAFMSAARDAGFLRHTGCMAVRGKACLWCDDTTG